MCTVFPLQCLKKNSSTSTSFGDQTEVARNQIWQVEGLGSDDLMPDLCICVGCTRSLRRWEHLHSRAGVSVSIDIKQRLAIALRVLALGGGQEAVAAIATSKLNHSVLHNSTVCKALRKVLQPEWADFWRMWTKKTNHSSCGVCRYNVCFCRSMCHATP